MIKKYYAIKKGHQSGVVVESWEKCKVLVDGYKGAIFKGFASHQKNQAEQFAKYGIYKNQTPKKKRKPINKETQNQRFNRLYKCVERKSYTDPFTGEFYNNRCVRRKGPTIIGSDYVETIDSTCPF